jgi:protein-S-isoprenylcysteine O-methyltransferase Ste14
MVLVLKNILFTVLVPGTAAVLLPFLIVRTQSAESGTWLILASVLFILGATIYSWCIWDFAVFGRGTPAPIDSPKRLVIRGLYRYSRNPMYVGVLTVVMGWAVLFKAPAVALYSLCLGLCFHSSVVFYEEPHLERLFGDSYAEYRTQVGRWLPRIRDTR